MTTDRVLASVEDWEDLLSTVIREHAAQLAAKDQRIETLRATADRATERADAAMGLLLECRAYLANFRHIDVYNNAANKDGDPFACEVLCTRIDAMGAEASE